FPEETPIPFFTSFALSQSADRYAIRCAPTASDETSNGVFWRRASSFCIQPTSQTYMFRTFGNVLLRRHVVNTGMQEIQPYRRLGGLLWHQRRLLSVGLMESICCRRTLGRDGRPPRPKLRRASIRDLQGRWLALVGKEL